MTGAAQALTAAVALIASASPSRTRQIRRGNDPRGWASVQVDAETFAVLVREIDALNPAILDTALGETRS